MREVDRKFPSARSMEDFLPLDHNIISRHKIWVILQLLSYSELQIIVHTGNYILFAFTRHIKPMNRLRIEGEKIIYVSGL